ncbi:MAG: hypothetical protein D6813_00960 [Calditrichaeota bacterium]|nr:MAG: hypothetical protein D6813_00960 [Calditrichota bacterium]
MINPKSQHPTNSESKTEEPDPLACYYLNEVQQHLTRLQEKITQLSKRPRRKKLLSQIRDEMQAVSDLAMIHGHEGAERIASKILTTINHFIEKDSIIDESFCNKVKVAILALQQVLSLEDEMEDEMTVESFGEIIELTHKKLKAYTNRLSKSFDQVLHRQMELPFDYSSSDLVEISKVQEDENTSHLFDIHEVDEVLSLDEKEGQATQDEKSPQKVKVVDISPSTQIPMSLTDEVPEVFSEYELKEDVENLEQAVYDLQIFPNSKNAMDSLVAASDNLMAKINKFYNVHLVQIIKFINQIIKQSLLTEVTPENKEKILNLLIETAEIINDYLELYDTDDSRLKQLIEKYKVILKDELKISTKNSKNQNSKANKPVQVIYFQKLGGLFKGLFKKFEQDITS